MYIGSFCKTYALDLMPRAVTDISLGDFIWKREGARPKMAPCGTSSHIYNVFLEEELLTERKWRSAMNALEAPPLEVAEVGPLEITTSKNFSRGFPHPLAQKIKALFTAEQQPRFWFSTLEVRTLSEVWREDIQERMEHLSPKALPENKKEQGSVHIITQLFYGQINFVLEKALKQVLGSLFSSEDHGLQLETTTPNEIHYSFPHVNVPFAMRVERLGEV